MFYSPIITILEVNTVSLRLLAFKKSGSFFRVVETLSAQYDGVGANGFNKPDKLFSIVQDLFNNLSHRIKFLPSKVHVILPQIFIQTAIAESQVSVRGKQVTQSDIAKLYAKCTSPHPDYAVIGHTPVSFRSLNNPLMLNPLGEECTKLYGVISVILLAKPMREFFDTASKRLRKNFIYVGESNLCIEKADKDINLAGATRLLIVWREEHISVNLCKGKAILAIKNIDWGANHVIYALQDLLKIDFDKARTLSNKLNLNVNSQDDDFYVLNDGQNLTEYNMKAVNKRAVDTLDFLAGSIKKAIESFKLDTPIPVYMTGNDVCQIRGFKELINNAIGSEMLETLTPDGINLDTATDYALCSYLEQINNKSTSYNFLKKGRTKR